MANTYLYRQVSSSDTNKNKVTISLWFKKPVVGVEQTLISGWMSDNNRWKMRFKSDDTLDAEFGYGGTYYSLRTNRLFRDTSGWYHCVLAYDTTQGTASERAKMYINGIQETSFQTEVYPPQNYGIYLVENTAQVGIGRGYYGGSYQSGTNWSGLMSHVYVTDGYTYTASTFGSTDSTTGEWKIKTDVSVTYGNNGFFILKDNNSVTDQSGKGNNFTLGAGTLTKTEDSPSNVFATWNPLQATTSASYDFSAGNTRMAVNDVAVFSLGATLAATTGKYYMEMKWVQQGGNGSWGMIPIDTNISNRPRNAGVGWNQGDNAPWLLGTIVSGSWGGSIGTNDIIQLAMDLDNGAFYFGKNGTYLNSGNPTSGASKTGAVDFSGTSLFGEQLTFAIGKGASGTDGWNANFGNGYFEQTAVTTNSGNGYAGAEGSSIFNYQPPTGYTALSTKGLNL